MVVSESRMHITRRNFLRGVGLMGASAALAACAQGGVQNGNDANASKAAPLLAIIHTNDTHGYDVEKEATENTEGNFSMAAVAQLKADWQAKGYDVLLVDAGDATQGTPLVDSSDGASAIAFMNSCGYDAMAVGNHEFDWGLEKLAENRKQAKFPMLSANVFDKDGKLLFEESKVFELSDGTKVGFFGLTTPSSMTSTLPEHVEGLTFSQDEGLFDCAQAQVDALRGKGCDLVVCLGHLGNVEAVGRNTSTDVLQNVTGIDLFIDGHDHQLVEEEVNGVLLTETGCYMHNIGVVVIDDGVPKNEPVAYGQYAGIEPATQAVIAEENARVEEQLGVVLGSTPFLLDGNRAPGVRTKETNLGDFCADAFRWMAEQETGEPIDAGLINGGGLRASIDAGDISLKEIKTVMPFANDMSVVRVTGARLLEGLEAACQNIGKDEPIGAFPQVSGIALTVDSTVPYEKGPNYPNSTFASPAAVGARVTITDVGGRGFDENETYSIATCSFMAMGGDTYYAFKDASDALSPVVFGFDYEAVASYLVVACDHKVPDEYAEAQGRITII